MRKAMKIEIVVPKQIQEKMEIDVEFPLYLKNWDVSEYDDTYQYVALFANGEVFTISKSYNFSSKRTTFEITSYNQDLKCSLVEYHEGFKATTQEDWGSFYQEALNFVAQGGE